MKTRTTWDRTKSFAISLVKPQTAEERRQRQQSNKQFVIQLVIYAALVISYFYLVLTHLSGWLTDLAQSKGPIFAVVAWGLIFVQGVVLEIIAVIVHRIVGSIIH
jgi:uncharacterized membrane protein YjdF